MQSIVFKYSSFFWNFSDKTCLKGGYHMYDLLQDVETIS